MTDDSRRNAQDDLHTAVALINLNKPWQSMCVWLTPAERRTLNALDIATVASERMRTAYQLVTSPEGTE